MTTAIAYLPVIHQGHLEFCRKVKPDLLYVLGTSFHADFPLLKRDIRALSPRHVAEIARALTLAPQVRVLEKRDIKKLRLRGRLVLADDEVMRELARRYFPKKRVAFIPAFLRWSKMAALTAQPVLPNRQISRTTVDRRLMSVARTNAERSSDWWRRVGSVIVRRGKVILTGWNIHQPSEHALYIDGDPRMNFNAGERSDIYSVIHGEANVIAQAAERGISLRGSSLYVTTFPCPNCALLIIRSGIRKVYYADGYSNLNAQENLKLAGVQIVRVMEKKKEATP